MSAHQFVASELLDSYAIKLEQYVRMNVRRPKWMPLWVFKRLMRFVVIEQSELSVALEKSA